MPHTNYSGIQHPFFPTETMFPALRSADTRQAESVKIHQRGVQWKQGVVICVMLYTSLFHIITPIHCTLPTAPPCNEYPRNPCRLPPCIPISVLALGLKAGGLMNLHVDFRHGSVLRFRYCFDLQRPTPLMDRACCYVSVSVLIGSMAFRFRSETPPFGD